jgi:hypothetical protein
MPSAGEMFAHYQLNTALHRPDGSVTEAFRATDTQTNNEVVLEIVRADATSIEKARFGTRSRRLVGLKHPGLTTALTVTPTYCAFETTAANEPLLSEHAGLAIARARQKLAWLSQVAAGLAALHKVAVVHGQLALGQIVLTADTTVKLTIPVGGDVSGSPLDDLRAFGAAACELLLGADATDDEQGVTQRINEAGIPPEAAAILGRVRAGAAMTSADLAEKLAPFAEYSGPSTEPLLAVMPSTEPLLQVARRSSPGDPT